jgi:hypothetical protein
MNNELLLLEQKAGIIFKGATGFQSELAMDAQSPLVSASNSSILSMLTTLIDPKLIEVLVSPMKAAIVVGSEVKKGDWTTQTTAFNMIEATGDVAAYGDYQTSGQAGVNFSYPQRQSFHYQVVTQWGELELDRAGLQKIDFANRLNMASILTLNKYQNKSYFFGVANLQNYGLLNDPSLSAAIAPTTKAAGGTTWDAGTALEIFNGDIGKLYKQLQTQSNGLVELDTPMTLAMSPTVQKNLTKITDFKVSVFDAIKANYPNMEIVTAPEYSTVSGELVQLIVKNLEAQNTAECAFTEKLRAHPVIVAESSWKQKKSQGTWGTVIYRPFLIAQMIGV